jgi:hypothetical protein
MPQGIYLFSNCGSAFRKQWDAWLRHTLDAKNTRIPSARFCQA